MDRAQGSAPGFSSTNMDPTPPTEIKNTSSSSTPRGDAILFGWPIVSLKSHHGEISSENLFIVTNAKPRVFMLGLSGKVFSLETDEPAVDCSLPHTVRKHDDSKTVSIRGMGDRNDHWADLTFATTMHASSFMTYLSLMHTRPGLAREAHTTPPSEAKAAPQASTPSSNSYEREVLESDGPRPSENDLYDKLDKRAASNQQIITSSASGQNEREKINTPQGVASLFSEPHVEPVERFKKPPEPLENTIISLMKEHKSSLKSGDIYELMETKYDYYGKHANKSQWKGSVRSVLWVSPLFSKPDPKRGQPWTFTGGPTEYTYQGQRKLRIEHGQRKQRIERSHKSKTNVLRQVVKALLKPSGVQSTRQLADHIGEHQQSIRARYKSQSSLQSAVYYVLRHNPEDFKLFHESKNTVHSALWTLVESNVDQPDGVAQTSDEQVPEFPHATFTAVNGTSGKTATSVNSVQHTGIGGSESEKTGELNNTATIDVRTPETGLGGAATRQSLPAETQLEVMERRLAALTTETKRLKSEMRDMRRRSVHPDFTPPSDPSTLIDDGGSTGSEASPEPRRSGRKRKHSAKASQQ
ncbi:hypothetical protein NA57DRAFT_78473 [Rhizodiscina lignyota]|uniref:Fork-head domain-containing protein n=1 Tax=Rhizodiscina lignyota TaxID=1504668 RepID=A0A9P4M4H1_9PEZI|nr:hypothetical protein NA57DRAFT_78473 [Rhizodiscina lignyota]